MHFVGQTVRIVRGAFCVGMLARIVAINGETLEVIWLDGKGGSVDASAVAVVD
jgi:hypothetical protein